MPVHPFFNEQFDRMRETLSLGLSQADLEAAIQNHSREQARKSAEWDSSGVLVEEYQVPGAHGPIPVRTYRPIGEFSSVLVWAHGGGFQSGDLDMPEGHVVCGELARRADAFVVSVDYRLARDGVRYPVPIDDVHAAWSALCRGDLPIHPTSLPIAIGGASAGAALAVATALRAHDHGPRTADALILAYPFAHFPNPALEEAVAAEMTALPLRCTPAAVEAMVRNYVGRISDLPADALPGAALLTNLPPTYIVVSEYDDLRPSAELLERQLREVGVPVTSQLAHGMVHGHLNNLPELPEIEESLEFLADALRKATVRDSL